MTSSQPVQPNITWNFKPGSFMETLANTAKGELPSNEQLEDLLKSVGKSRFLHSLRPKLSHDGQILHDAIIRLLRQLRRTIKQKNKESSLQHFCKALSNTTTPSTTGIFYSSIVKLINIAEVRRELSKTIKDQPLGTLELFRDLLVIDWWKLLQRFIKFLSHPPPPAALRDTTILRDTSKTTDDRTSLAFREAKTSFLSETIAASTSAGTRDSGYSSIIQGNDQDYLRAMSKKVAPFDEDEEEEDMMEAEEENIKDFIDSFKRWTKKALNKRVYWETLQQWSSFIITWLQFSTGENEVKILKEWSKDVNLRQAFQSLKKLVEAFCNGHSLDPLLKSSKEIFFTISKDPNWQTYLEELQTYIDSLQSSSVLQGDLSTGRGIELVIRGQELAQPSQPQFLSLNQEIQELSKDYKDDEQTQVLVKSLMDFKNALFNERPISSDLLLDFRDVYLPAIMENLPTMALPNLVSTSPKGYWSISHLELITENLIPDTLKIEMLNQIEWDFKKSLDKHQHDSGILISGLRLNFNQFQFFYRMHTFPRLEDEGIATLLIHGLNIKAAMGHKKIVDCKIDQIYLGFKQTRHRILYSMFHPCIVRALKRRIIQSIQDFTLDLLTGLEGPLTGLTSRKKIREAQLEEGKMKTD